MPDSKHRCPKCDGQMEEGYLLDHTHGGRMQARWIQGQPVRSFWTGLRIADVDRRLVRTYRCTKCGFLESYALDPA